ncbi:LptF/LptG family permease [Planctomycetaceae bacterium SH139]
MTCIDRYILRIYLRTLLVCFVSFAGIFVVFHAFTNMDELNEYGEQVGGIGMAMALYYGPYMLMLFEMTNMIVALLALLFTFGLLRRTGELTALLAAGISHGRIVRPMLIAALLVILGAAINREFVLPNWQDQLGLKVPSPDGGGELRPLLPVYDRVTGILVNGKGLQLTKQQVVEPALKIHALAPGFGNQLNARLAQWIPHGEQHPGGPDHPAGYVLSGVSQPAGVDSLSSFRVADSTMLLTARDTPWLAAGEVFVASRVEIDFLQSGSAWMRMANTGDLIRRVSNPAVYCSADVAVTLHDRWLRPCLDYSLIILSLSLVVGRGQRNMFLVTGYATGLVLLFFGLRTLFHMMGGNGYLLDPASAAWLPVLILTPAAYARYRLVRIS